MRVFFDTEFTSLDGNIDWDLISAGFVAEDGQEWYCEITDFSREACSDFVVENVIPQLGRTAVEYLTGGEFGRRLVQWLGGFGQDIELISDASCDWWLVSGYAHREFLALPYPVIGQVWLPSHTSLVAEVLADQEAVFWAGHAGWQHHALYDARRLKRLVECQREVIGLLATSDADMLPPAGIRSIFLHEEEDLVGRMAKLGEGDDW